jgi:hypothetical protein
LEGATIGKTISISVYIKNNLLQNQRPISVKLGTNHPWVKGIKNFTNKGPSPLQRGDNHKTQNGVG